MNPLCLIMQLTFHNKLEYYSTELVFACVLSCVGPSVIDGCMLAQTFAYSHKNNRHLKSPVTFTQIN